MPTPITILPRQRIASVDAFRGITFLVMLFVNCLAGARGIPYGIQHMAASVDGMSLADVVFPAFLFTVGMSIPFGINGRILKGDSCAQVQWHIACRAFGLVLIGFFMVNTEAGYNERAMGMRIESWALAFYAAALLAWGVYRFESAWLNRTLRLAGAALIIGLGAIYRSGVDGSDWMAPEWWGILGCIGWAYLAASLLYQLVAGRVALLLGAVAACVLWFAASRAGAVGDVFAMHATHTSIVLSGLVCALLFFDAARVGGDRRRFAEAGLVAAGLALAAWLLHRAYPISKIGATPPWALYCAALFVALFALLYWLLEVRKLRRWTAAVEPVASNPLVTYFIPIVLATAMGYFHLRWWAPLTQGAGALAFALAFSFGVAWLVSRLNAVSFKLKL